MVTCLVCGKKLSLINGLHLRSHGMTAQEYRARFPDAEVSSSDFRKKRSKVMTERWQDPEIRAQVEESCRQAQLKAWEGNDERRKAYAERAPEMVEKIWSDHEKRERMSQRRRKTALKMWKDGAYRKRTRIPTKWNKCERRVRRWLKRMGLYRGPTPSFYPHFYLPTKEAGFTANADFVDPISKLVVHVDGVHWHSLPKSVERDQRLDKWCDANDWLYLRLTDEDIKTRPRWCRQQIRALVSRRLPGLE